jgi:hypothetical protein
LFNETAGQRDIDRITSYPITSHGGPIMATPGLKILIHGGNYSQKYPFKIIIKFIHDKNDDIINPKPFQ